MSDPLRTPRQPDPGRRRFVGGALASAALAPIALEAQATGGQSLGVAQTELRGTQFDLEIAPWPVRLLDSDTLATAINGTIPGPVLRMREGDTVTLRVTNRLPVSSSIHWHGLLLPTDMDGVPGLSFDGIAPGETFVYRFPVRQSGTYWYHSHSRFQEQTGVYGPIVIEPRGAERFPVDREHVVMLSDWTTLDPERIYARLKKMSDFFNRNQPTVPLFFRDIQQMGLAAALDRRRMWNTARMNPTDFSDVSDVTGRTFVYLVNGATVDGNWTGLFKPGERVKLRFINGAATTIFDVRIPGLKLTVVAADGQDVEPVTVDEFRISVAETYDVIVEPRSDEAYTIFAQSIGRTGFARATLAPRSGMQAAIPPQDEPEWLTMTDMMGAMAHGGSAGHGAPADAAAPAHAAPGTGAHGPAAPRVRHARTEYGPLVDMHVDMPRTNLDDPGVNLRNNGRRVLTYADLHTIGGPVDPRGAEREVELHLTGHMQRFVWSFDGQKFSESRPVHLRYGERVRIVLVNDTMMNHPIHLHGLWSEVESPDGRFQVRKHTVNVQPAQRITYLVAADAPGRWAYHCHLLYHMEAGMFREVVVL